MGTKRFAAAVTSLLAFALAWGLAPVASADGTIDKTFGDQGGTIFDPSANGEESVDAVVIDRQGRIVVAGSTFREMAPNQAFFARFLPNGQPDPEFGTGGYLELPSSGSSSIIELELDSQGRIVASGNRVMPGTGFDFMLVRLRADGTLDPDFSGDGIATFDFANQSDIGSGLAIDPQDRIVMTGSGNAGGRLTVIRVNADGSLDGGYGAGNPHPFVGGTYSRGAEVEIDGAGSALIVGQRQLPGGPQLIVVKLKSDGTLDVPYGIGGVLPIEFGTSPSVSAKDIELDGQGRAVIAGTVGGINDDDPYNTALARVLPSSQLDTSFASGGRYISQIPEFDFLQAITIDRAGRIAGAGGFYKSGPLDVILQRFNDGGVDSTFGDGGKVLTDLFQSGADGQAITIDGEGRYVVAGRGILNSDTRIMVARFDVDYPLPSPPPPPPPPPAVKCGGKKATIVGTARRDRIKGTKRRDVIAGLGGNDVIKGLGGNDLICGGSGDDTLIGGPGNDTLRGEAGRDLLKGGPGRDKLNGGKGRDRCLAGPKKGRLTGCERRR